MKIVMLTNNSNSKPVIDFLVMKGNEVIEISDPVTKEDIKREKPDFVVSYNYRHIVRKEVIDLLPDRIINLHISMLPWSRGG